MSTFELRRHDGASALQLMDQLADAYMEGYADDPDVGRSIYARDEFVRRTTRQAAAPGFVLVTAHAEDRWAGFSFGLHFPAGRWWAGDAEGEPPGEVKQADKFAVIELVVLPAARGVGLATELMTAVLADLRPGARALQPGPAAAARDDRARPGARVGRPAGPARVLQPRHQRRLRRLVHR